MARLPRLVIPHQPHHIIQRGNNRQPIFCDENDYVFFLRRLKEAAKTYKVVIHAYVLMPNHIHLLASPTDSAGLSRMMQWVGRQYVPYFNKKYERTGTLWEGRYRAAIIDSERYFLICSRYIELNPVRAGLVSDPAMYPWSSLAHHIGLKSDPLISDHRLYWSLGNTPFDRELAYKNLIEQATATSEADLITQATIKGWVLGSEDFKLQISKQTMRPVAPGKRGRPAHSMKTVPSESK